MAKGQGKVDDKSINQLISSMGTASVAEEEKNIGLQGVFNGLPQEFANAKDIFLLDGG